MDYGIDFSDNVQKRKKKIIFIVIFAIFIVMFVAFFFRNSNNAFVSKVASIVSSPISGIYVNFNLFLDFNSKSPLATAGSFAVLILTLTDKTNARYKERIPAL